MNASCFLLLNILQVRSVGIIAVQPRSIVITPDRSSRIYDLLVVGAFAAVGSMCNKSFASKVKIKVSPGCGEKVVPMIR